MKRDEPIENLQRRVARLEDRLEALAKDLHRLTTERRFLEIIQREMERRKVEEKGGL